jgi:hypothetical protein
VTEPAASVDGDPIEVLPKALDKLETLETLLQAVEGYRNQLSVFADSALLEIAILKRWLRDALEKLERERAA